MKVGDKVILRCEVCGDETACVATGRADDGLPMASVPRDGWFFSSETGWRCPKDAPAVNHSDGAQT